MNELCNFKLAKAKAFTEELNELIKKHDVVLRVEPGLGIMCFKKATTPVEYRPSRINRSHNQIIYHLVGEFK